jgi:large subunit ribosomal protein L15
MADSNLKVHHLKPAPGSHTKKTRVGRGEGGKRGKTAGRGTKGTKARYQVSVGFEGGTTPIQMRLPKMKGFKNRNRVEFQVVNVAQLAKLFPQGGAVGILDLVQAGLVRDGELVKVLGNGDISVKVDVTANARAPGTDGHVTPTPVAPARCASALGDPNHPAVSLGPGMGSSRRRPRSTYFAPDTAA